MSSTPTLAVIGGGAAGFFCAVNAARIQPNLRVIILEKSGKCLAKVRVSGGGRCNVTHACFDIDDMSREYPRGRHFVKKTFHRFFTLDTIEWFESRGVKLKTESDGRMFPVTDSSQTIIDCLLREADLYGVDLRLHSDVMGIIRTDGKFYIQINGKPDLVADYLCVATGGYPRPGMFDWLRNTGHTIIEPVPSLFTFNLPKHPMNTLMGVSVNPARVSIPAIKAEEDGPLLITHWGLSGPAVLTLSARCARELAEKKYSFSIRVNWLPGIAETELRELFKRYRNERAGQKAIGKINPGLPARLWEFLALQSGVTTEMRWADLPSGVMNAWIRNLSAFSADINGKTTFREEFVTAGGIALNEVDPQTLMSKKIPGLFFAGEVLDVDGVTGGFNFQHAWTSGWIAAAGIHQMLNE